MNGWHWVLLAGVFVLGWICGDLRREWVWQRDYESRHPE